MRYEPPAINFHLGETPPQEPQGGGEQTTARGTVVRQFHRTRSSVNFRYDTEVQWLGAAASGWAASMDRGR
jgi:hypothetical protein